MRSTAILILKRDNTTIVIQDWIYPFPPTTYYYHRDLLNIETYMLDYISKDGTIAYYNYLKI